MNTEKRSELKKWGVLVTTLVASVTVIMNASLQNVALPQYIEEFGISTVKAQWVISLFSLSLLIAITVAPYFARKYGYRNIFLGGIALLIAGALIGGFANQFNVMLVARVFQGLGGGLLTPICLVLIRENFGVDKQGFAMGLWSFCNMLAPAIAPTIGGIILENSSWNYLFFINIPPIIITIIATFIFLNSYNKKSTEKNYFDWIGFALISIGLISLVLAIEQLQRPTQPYMPYILFSIAIICLTLFVLQSFYGKQPLLNIRILKNGLFTSSLIIVACCAFTMTSLTFIVPILMQQVLQVSPTISGVATLPHALMVGVFGIIGGKMLDKYGPKTAIYPGLIVLIGVSFFLFFSLNMLSLVGIMVCIGIIGIGNGILSTTTVATALSNVHENQLREGASFVNIVKHIGKVVIVVIVAYIYDGRKLHYLSENASPEKAGMSAVQDVYLFLAIFLVAMIPVVWFICKKYKEAVLTKAEITEEIPKDTTASTQV